jgi:hypothetical protein
VNNVDIWLMLQRVMTLWPGGPNGIGFLHVCCLHVCFLVPSRFVLEFDVAQSPA